MADNTDIKYTLILEGIDKLQHGMESSKHHTDALNESMHHLKTGVMELVGAYAGFEVLKESLEEFEKHQVAVADLTQMYKNNGEAVGMTLDQLKELAEKQENLAGIHSEVTMAAESTLMKYKDLKISYEELIPLAGDMGTKMGGTEEAANMLGRALENPAKAMRLLTQAGVSPEQQQMYKNLAKTGHAAESQAMLIDILKDKYQGLAQAAYEADPSAQLAIGFKQLKESIGSLIEDGLVAVMPYLKAFMEGVKSFIGFLKDHEGVITFLVGSLVTIGVAMKAQALYTAFAATTFGGFALELGIATAAEYAAETGMIALNAAMDANPIGLVVIAVAALVGVLMAAKKQYDDFIESIEAVKRAGVASSKDHLFAETDRLMKIKGMTLELAETQALASETRLRMKVYETAKLHEEDLKQKASLYDSIIPSDELIAAHKQTLAAQASIISLQGKGAKPFEGYVKGEKGKTGKAGEVLTAESKADKVTGQKQVTINVSMKDLVGVVNIASKTVGEGVTNMGEHVAKALLSAVDQFSASADI